jgi:HEAT repeat protein
MKLSHRVVRFALFLALFAIATVLEFPHPIGCSSSLAAEVILADQIAALQSPEQLSREMALVRISQLGGNAAPAIPAIIPVLKADPAEGVRIVAAQALGRIGNPSEASGPALLAAFDDASISVRVASIQSLRQLGWEKQTVVQKLIGMAAHESWVQRVAVAEGLMIARELKDQPDIEQAASTTLLKLLADPYVLVRSAAARSLGGIKMGADAAIPALIVAAADPDWRVRRDTASALGSFGEQAASANDVLVTLLRDPDHETRLRAGQSLRAVNPTGAFDLVMAAAKDGNENIRTTAIEAIGRYGASEQVIAALAGALGDGSADVRFRAVRALDAMGPGAKPALEALTKCVNDRNCIVREYSCRALGRMGPEAASAVSVLNMASTDDWHGGTRKSALAALKAIQPAPAPAPAN